VSAPKRLDTPYTLHFLQSQFTFDFGERLDGKIEVGLGMGG
jgi:hypothetical protein